jgi:hypothetical protein
MPDEHKPRPPHRLRAFWIFVAALLLVNLLSVMMSQRGGEPRVKVPFSPYFLRQVDAGRRNVRAWSICGAEWTQTAADVDSSTPQRGPRNPCRSLHSLATSRGGKRMVRRGSTVRVRQRALKSLQIELFVVCC